MEHDISAGFNSTSETRLNTRFDERVLGFTPAQFLRSIEGLLGPANSLEGKILGFIPEVPAESPDTLKTLYAKAYAHLHTTFKDPALDRKVSVARVNNTCDIVDDSYPEPTRFAFVITLNEPYANSPDKAQFAAASASSKAPAPSV
jgi:hypothetical protein